MPKIPRFVIDSVFYLYESAEDAKAGRNPGGTGFVVSYRSNARGNYKKHHYGVTNWHVAVDGNTPVIRFNTRDGDVDIVDAMPDQWEFLPGKYDIAVTPLEIGDEHKVTSIPTDLFLPQYEFRRRNGVSVGEDVFMLGLFVDHDGVSANIPSARFGNISVMPNAKSPILQPTGYRGESYILDMHSRTGFSGSPVFVYRTFGSSLGDSRRLELKDIELTKIKSHTSYTSTMSGPDGIKAQGTVSADTLFYFLGIHWGQFPEDWELMHQENISEERNKHLVTDGAYVRGMSGMTCVMPASQILEVLEMPKLQKRRAIADAEISEAGPVAEGASRQPTSENPTHREDFKSLLGKAARTPPQDD